MHLSEIFGGTGVKLTSPRRTCKHNSILRNRRQAFLQNLEAITFNPPDLVLDAVNGSIVFRAFQRIGVFLNAEDLVPATGPRKRNGVASNARKRINEYRFRGRGRLSDMLCDFTFFRTIRLHF